MANRTCRRSDCPNCTRSSPANTREEPGNDLLGNRAAACAVALPDGAVRIEGRPACAFRVVDVPGPGTAQDYGEGLPARGQRIQHWITETGRRSTFRVGYQFREEDFDRKNLNQQSRTRRVGPNLRTPAFDNRIP